MSKQPPPAPTASAVGPCPTVIQIVGRPGLNRRGWSGGAMVLEKLPGPGCPTIWMIVVQGLTALVVGAGGGCLDNFTLLYLFFPFFISLGDSPI